MNDRLRELEAKVKSLEKHLTGEPLIVDVAGASKLIPFSATQLRKMCQESQFPTDVARKVGRRWMFQTDRLKKFIFTEGALTDAGDDLLRGFNGGTAGCTGADTVHGRMADNATGKPNRRTQRTGRRIALAIVRRENPAVGA